MCGPVFGTRQHSSCNPCLTLPLWTQLGLPGTTLIKQYSQAVPVIRGNGEPSGSYLNSLGVPKAGEADRLRDLARPRIG
jgi:hypothetical protein